MRAATLVPPPVLLIPCSCPSWCPLVSAPLPGKALKLSRLSFAGVYLHGSVGSGKSLMLDLLAAAVAREAAVPHLRRLHFNSAMLELHRWGLS